MRLSMDAKITSFEVPSQRDMDNRFMRTRRPLQILLR